MNSDGRELIREGGGLVCALVLVSDLANLRSTAKPEKQRDPLILKEMSAWWFNTGFSIMESHHPPTKTLAGDRFMKL